MRERNVRRWLHRAQWAMARERDFDARIGWLSVRFRGRGPVPHQLSGDFSAQHVGQLQGALSEQRLHSEDRVQHGAAGIGWQSVDHQSESVPLWLRVFDHADRRLPAANGLFLRRLLRRSSSGPDSGIQRHPVWNDALRDDLLESMRACPGPDRPNAHNQRRRICL